MTNAALISTAGQRGERGYILLSSAWIYAEDISNLATVGWNPTLRMLFEQREHDFTFRQKCSANGE
jgi:hypothetical protein